MKFFKRTVVKARTVRFLGWSECWCPWHF